MNATRNDGQTALMAAANGDPPNPEVITALLKAGADAKAKDVHGNTAFDYARHNDKLAGTEVYKELETAAVDFFTLAKTGTPQGIQAAIDLGAAVNAQSDDGVTALMYAAGYNQNPDVTTTLLKAGAEIAAQDTKDGLTVLMYAAAFNQNPEIINTLVKAGADLKARDKDGMTALMWAANGNPNPGVIMTLLKAGADINARESYGATALMLAACNNQNVNVVTTLLKSGADLKSRDKEGLTALFYAAWKSENPEVIIALLKAGADAKAKDNSGKTAFDYAKNNEKLIGTDVYWRLNEAQY